jgi:hypothetical protein
MRLMAVLAGLVAHWGAGEFLRVARLALRDHSAAMRFVTALALLVPGPHFASLVRVASAAGRSEHCRLMGQPPVTALTSGVTDTLRAQRELLLMAPLAEMLICQVDLEVMRRMALLAGNPGVEGMVCGGNLMATAATPCNQLFLPTSGMRIVAGQTGGARDAFGMISVNVPVALGAGGGGSAAHVVRRVATRAHGVRGHD